MTSIEKSIEIKAPIEKVFGYCADYKNVLNYMQFLTKLEPTTEVKTKGVGNRFYVEGESGLKYKSELEITEFEENKGWTEKSISGVKTEMRWEFKPTERGTRVSCRVDYEVPYGLAGKIADELFVKRITDKNFRKSLENLRKLLEE